MADKFTKWLQDRLNSTGEFKLEITGRNDKPTQEAIRLVQRALGLRETGTATRELVDAVRNYKPQPITGSATMGAEEPPPGASVTGSMQMGMNPPMPNMRPGREPSPEMMAMGQQQAEAVPLGDAARGPDTPMAPQGFDRAAWEERTKQAMLAMQNNQNEMRGGMARSPEARPSYREGLMQGRDPATLQPPGRMAEVMDWGPQNAPRGMGHVDIRGANSPLAMQQSYTPDDISSIDGGWSKAQGSEGLASAIEDRRQPDFSMADPQQMPPENGMVGFTGGKRYGSIGEMAGDYAGSARDAVMGMFGGDQAQAGPTEEQRARAKQLLMRMLEERQMQ